MVQIYWLIGFGGSWMLISSSTGNELKELTEILVVLPSQDVNVSIDRKLFSVSFSHRVGLWLKNTDGMWNLSTAVMMSKSVDIHQPVASEAFATGRTSLVLWPRLEPYRDGYTHSGDWLPFCFMAEKSFVCSFTMLLRLWGHGGHRLWQNTAESMGELDESWIDRMAKSWHSGLLGIPQTSPRKQTAGVSPLLLLREWRELPSWCLAIIFDSEWRCDLQYYQHLKYCVCIYIYILFYSHYLMMMILNHINIIFLTGNAPRNGLACSWSRLVTFVLQIAMWFLVQLNYV